MKKSERLNQELIYLRDKSYFQLNDLMSIFDISKRTAIRDVQELESLGLAIYSEFGPGGGYKIIHHSSILPIYFTIQEIQAVFYALKSLEAITETPFNKNYPHILAKLYANLSKSQQEVISQTLEVMSYYNVAPVSYTNYLEKILEAIIEERIVQLTYTQHQETSLHLQFYELFYRNGIWFTSAYDHLSKAWGTFRCDYMEEMTELTAEVYPIKRREELVELQDNYEARRLK